jgi:RNAse (barnase) inhibitor barstar|tara:strand:- start:493 stop:975 length:483 start_codon:yes stop_codon:yes gene_type:complete
MRLDTLILSEISSQLEEYREDLDVFWDTLDGETDIMDVVGVILEHIIETDANINAMDEIAKKYSERKSGLKSKREGLTKSLKSILLLTGQTKIPHGIATVSLRNGVESLVIRDEAQIPSQLCKVFTEPDRAEIKKQLKAGVEIEGAELTTGPQTISIRMK